MSSRRTRDATLRDEILEEEEQYEQTIAITTPQETSASKRNVRGVTKGLSVQKKCQSTEKLDVIIHPTRNRIVGENAKHFKTEACVIVKQYAGVQHPRWKNIPQDNKRKMWTAMKQKFNLEEDGKVKNVVYDQLNRQYRSYRHKLHIHYLKNKGEPDILDKSPIGVTPEDWKLLMDYFESDGFKKISGRNKENRQKLEMKNACGTKSIAQSCYEERDRETGDEPTRTAAWRLSRYNKEKKNWIDEASKKVYDELIRLQSEPLEEGGDPMTEEEAFIKVLGEEKSGRLRGCGDGLKPPSKRGERVNLELQRENEELRKQNEELTSQFVTLKAQVNTNEMNMQAFMEQQAAFVKSLSEKNLI